MISQAGSFFDLQPQVQHLSLCARQMYDELNLLQLCRLRSARQDAVQEPVSTSRSVSFFVVETLLLPLFRPEAVEELGYLLWVSTPFSHS